MGLHPIDTFLRGYLKIKKSFDKRPTDIEDFSADAIKKILVVSSTAIGDTLLSTPAIRAVRRRYPKAMIVALFNAENMALFSNNPNIDAVVPFYGGYRKFFSTVNELKGYKFDLALIFHGNEPPVTALCYLSGARFIFKLPNISNYNFLLSNREPLVTWEELGHGIEARIKVAELARCKSIDSRMELFVGSSAVRAVDDFFATNGAGKDAVLIGFQPGASTVSRQWFPDRFIELGKRLVSEIPGARIVLTGSAQEAALCEKIAAGIGSSCIVSAGKLPLTALPPLMKRIRCLVTGDTGPMHIAITTGTPVVALYAVADSARSGPFYDKEKHRVIQKAKTCDPCVGKNCDYQKCMEAITADEVASAVKEVI